MECCGYERETNYCSFCGKSLNHNPGRMLLLHLERAASGYENEANAAKRYIDNGSMSESQRKDAKLRLARKENLYEKWNSWAQFVRNALDKEASESEREAWDATLSDGMEGS